MSDSQLTSAAARAAGIELEPDSDHPDGSHWVKDGTRLPDGQCVYHPLRDNAQAFRLSVALDIEPTFNGDTVTCIAINKSTFHTVGNTQPVGANKLAAVRRAIVTTAAALAPID